MRSSSARPATRTPLHAGEGRVALAVHEALAESAWPYPNVEQTPTINITISPGQPQAEQASGPPTWRFTSKDGAWTVSLTQDFLALEATRYTTWDEFGERLSVLDAWERQGTAPRPTTVRRLLQHHAVVAAVVDRLGEDDAQAWLAAGSPSPVELLLAVGLDAVDERVGEPMFARSAAAPPAGGYLPDFDADEDRPPSYIAAERG